MAFGDSDLLVHRFCLSALGCQLGRIPDCRYSVGDVQQCLSYPETQKCLIRVSQQSCLNKFEE